MDLIIIWQVFNMAETEETKRNKKRRQLVNLLTRQKLHYRQTYSLIQ